MEHRRGEGSGTQGWDKEPGREGTSPAAEGACLKAAPDIKPGLAARHPIGADYSQLSHIALRMMAETQHEGNTRYGIENWRKGIPISNLLSHAMAHLLALQNGDTGSESIRQHFGHALWNIEKAAHFIYTRPDLVDIMPLYVALGLNSKDGE